MLPELVGTHPTIESLRRRVPKLAAQDTRLVIIGEPGVGKSLLVAHVHERSPRSSNPLLSVDISLLNERDQRISLFGGGYPELPTTRRSVLEHPTTVMIKQIDHAGAYLQDRLAECLTVMQVRRPGRRETREVKCRLIFTLHRSPSELRRTGQITPSLHLTLKACKTIKIPPLRRRTEDILELVQHFHRDTANPALVDALKRHQWKENILELKAYLRTLVERSHEEVLREHERQQVAKMIMMIEEGDAFSLHRSLTAIGDGIIDRALSRTNGNHTKAAWLLGLSEGAIRRRINSLMSY